MLYMVTFTINIYTPNVSIYTVHGSYGPGYIIHHVESICLVSAWSGYLELDRAFLTSSTGISLRYGNLGNEQTLKQAENDVANEVLGYMYYFCSEYRDIL